MIPTPRPLQPSDIEGWMELKRLAGWNQTRKDLGRMLTLAPTGCWGIEIDHTLVATGTAITYGHTLAWIGMILTHPDYRRRGLASIIMDQLLAQLRAENVAWVKLDATAMGAEVYKRYGFEVECELERWSGYVPPGLSPKPFEPFHFNPELDLQVFGADRTPLIRSLAGAGAASTPTGYVLWRPGSDAGFLGPCVTSAPSEALLLIQTALSNFQPGTTTYVDLFPKNGEIFRQLGFEPRRHLLRMGLRLNPSTPPIEGDTDLSYALAGFEFG